MAHIAELDNLVDGNAGFWLRLCYKFIDDDNWFRESIEKVGESHKNSENEPLCDFVDFLEFFWVLFGLKSDIEYIKSDNSIGIRHKLLDTVLISHILDTD
jgi:hypothetical protein